MGKEKTFDEIIQDELTLADTNAEHVWSLVDQDIQPPEALLNYSNEPVIFKNSTVLIQGKTGTHKSRFAAALVSLLLSDDMQMMRYGFSKQIPSYSPVIYIDTERDKKHQLPLMVKQLIRDTGISKESLRKRLILLPLSEVSRDLRLNVLGKKVTHLNDQKPEDKSLVIVLDVISDFARDFNSVEATNRINDALNYANSKFDVTFITIIHENPGEGEKARGHLGSELTNKASTIFQIAGVKGMPGTFRIKMLKSRITPLYDEVLLKFDPVSNNLQIVTDEDILARSQDPEAFKLGLALAKKMFATIERKELIEYLEGELHWKERKIEDKLKLFVENAVQFETIFGPKILVKERGKRVVYKKVQVEPSEGEITVPVPDNGGNKEMAGDQEPIPGE